MAQVYKACNNDLSKIKSCIKLVGFVNSTDDFVGTFEPDFVGTFTRDSTQDFTRNSTDNFTQVFTGDFSTTFESTFTGNFLGALINNATETIETYTLYVRTA